MVDGSSPKLKRAREQWFEMGKFLKVAERYGGGDDSLPVIEIIQRQLSDIEIRKMVSSRNRKRRHRARRKQKVP